MFMLKRFWLKWVLEEEKKDSSDSFVPTKISVMSVSGRGGGWGGGVFEISFIKKKSQFSKNRFFVNYTFY